MTDQVIVVPKRDELVGVLYAFDIDPNEKSAERLPNGVELWRAAAVPKTTVALLDRQTNTNSGILTLHVINRENPYQIYLVGTALGNPRKAPVASVFVGKSITDISERRPSPDDPFGWQPNGPHASPELTSSASQFVQTHYWSPANRRRFFDDLELPSDLQGEYYERTLKRVRKDLPMISAEQILSGNEYIMTSDRRLGGQSPVWDRYQSYRAYDMEAAGFRLAAESAETPWLVVRGTSDHGTERTRADRVYAAAAAAKVLREFLESGQNNTETIRAPRPKFVGSSLLDLNGLFRGFMGYFDDENELVVYDETCEFENLGNAVIKN